MKKIFIFFIIFTLSFYSLVFAGKNYISRYAYPDKVKTVSIYDLLKIKKSKTTVSKKTNNSSKSKSSTAKNTSKSKTNPSNAQVKNNTNEINKNTQVNTNYYSFIFDAGKNIIKKYDFTRDSEYLFFSDIKDISSLVDIKFDNNKIPMANYNGHKYNPLLICQYGLQNYSFYKRYNDYEKFKNAVLSADYLVKAIDKSGKYINDFSYKYENNNITSPWSSSLCQGLAISLLVRVYNETKDTKYLDAAKLSLEPLLKSEKDGGLLKSFNGHAFYDMLNLPSKYTLSSHIFVLLSLYDIGKYDNRAMEKFYDGLYTLKDIIPTYYNSLDTFYKNIHTSQMEAINSILGVENFNEYFEDFQLIDIE